MVTLANLFLGIIAAELGFVVLFLVIFICMEVMNGMYVRKCYAEAQKIQAEAAANNPLHGLDLRNIQLPGMSHAGGAPQGPTVPAATPCTKDAEGECKECTGDCKSVKADRGGTYA